MPRRNSEQARQPLFLVLGLVKGLASAEQQRDASNTDKSYNGIAEYVPRH